MSAALKLLRRALRRAKERVAPGLESPAAVKRLSGWRRIHGELAWQLTYGLGEMVMSHLRMRWVKLKNPHAEIRFGGYCRLGPGFSLSMPEGGRFIAGKYNDFRRGFRAEVGPDGTIKIGDLCVFSHFSLIQCDTSIEIGDRVMFGQSSIVVDGNHRFRDPSTPLVGSGYDYKSITIENDATTLTKVTIIDNVGIKAVVGANSVVTKPVPPYSLVAGVPATLLDYFGPPELEPEEWRRRQRERGIDAPAPRGERLEVAGHSLAFGGGVSNFANRFSTRLADLLALDEVNHAVSGAVACWPQSGSDPGDGGYAHVLQSFARPGELGADWKPPALVLVGYGVNDLALLGPGELLPFRHALRTVISRGRACTVFEETDASVSGDRAWRPRAAAGPDCSGEGVLEADVPAAGIDIAVPAEFPGGVAALGFTVAAGADARVEIAVDGEEARAFDFTGATDPVLSRPNGVVARVEGLAPGAHQLRCTVTRAAGPVGFDYWQVEPDTAPRVLIPLAYVLANPMHHYADWPHQPTAESIEDLNRAMRGVAREFGAGAVTVDCRLDSDLFSWDRFYPNDAGHERIAEGLAAAARVRHEIA